MCRFMPIYLGLRLTPGNKKLSGTEKKETHTLHFPDVTAKQEKNTSSKCVTGIILVFAFPAAV